VLLQEKRREEWEGEKKKTGEQHPSPKASGFLAWSKNVNFF